MAINTVLKRPCTTFRGDTPGPSSPVGLKYNDKFKPADPHTIIQVLAKWDFYSSIHMRGQATDMSGHSGMREECLREACRSCSEEPECQIYPASSLLNQAS